MASTCTDTTSCADTHIVCASIAPPALEATHPSKGTSQEQAPINTKEGRRPFQVPQHQGCARDNQSFTHLREGLTLL